MTYGILGQQKPAAVTLTALYTVPVGKKAVVASIVACNQHATNADAVRISLALNGAADNAKQYIAFDQNVPAKDALVMTLGFALSAGDIIRVYTTNGTCSFNCWGAEMSA